MRDNTRFIQNKARTNQRENSHLAAVVMAFSEGKLGSEIDAAALIFPIAVACRLGPLSAAEFRRLGVSAGSTGSTGCEAGRAFTAGYRRARLRCLGGLVRDNRLDLAFEQRHSESIPHHATRRQGKMQPFDSR